MYDTRNARIWYERYHCSYLSRQPCAKQRLVGISRLHYYYGPGSASHNSAEGPTAAGRSQWLVKAWRTTIAEPEADSNTRPRMSHRCLPSQSQRQQPVFSPDRAPLKSASYPAPCAKTLDISPTLGRVAFAQAQPCCCVAAARETDVRPPLNSDNLWSTVKP